MRPVQIKVEYNQLLEMATAFGAPWLDAALVVILDFIDFRVKEPKKAFSTINATESKWATKAASSQGAPKTPSFYAQASLKCLDPESARLSRNEVDLALGP